MRYKITHINNTKDLATKTTAATTTTAATAAENHQTVIIERKKGIKDIQNGKQQNNRNKFSHINNNLEYKQIEYST